MQLRDAKVVQAVIDEEDISVTTKAMANTTLENNNQRRTHRHSRQLSESGKRPETLFCNT
jgi:hypothetical protein